jgi:23S rRNA (cytosine1962-C5)-methyltransferase
VFAQPALADYELVDSGGGEKLERYAGIVVRRPDPQALWRRRAADSVWLASDLAFGRDPASGGKRGSWTTATDLPREWIMRWRSARCLLRPTPFKHVGVFPEQAANWAWIEALRPLLDGARPRLLNLFGYTGVASVVAARSGYEVTHVDASRASLEWMRANARASGLAADAIRIVLDDALAFARREARRKASYAAILVDPPHHGRGPKGETWQLEDHLAPLIEACASLLERRAALVLSTYAVGFTALAFHNLLSEIGGASVESGELALRESGAGARWLSCGFCARAWRGVEPPATEWSAV